MSIAKRSLNKKHRQRCEELCQAKITLNDDGMMGISTSQRSEYIIERHMPLRKMPRLDLYFDNKELTTLSLLSCACMEFICKSNNEYCLLKFSPNHRQNVPPIDPIIISTSLSSKYYYGRRIDDDNDDDEEKEETKKCS